jgi:hypothetical protein
MANEFKVKNGLYVSGSTTITEDTAIAGSLTVSSGITGSLYGTASWAENVVTASYAETALSSSYAITASYALFAINGGSGGGSGYAVTHSQAIAATTWSFTHNLNTRIPLVQVYDLSYEQIIPNEIVNINVLTTEIRFDYAQAGYAVASTGGSLAITGSTSRVIQSIPATTWSFSHNLGTKYPGFEVYNSNDDVIIPAGIHVVDEDNAEIYFANPTSGTAIANFSGINGLSDNAVSASYASTASFITGSNVFGPFGANSVTSASYANFAETASYALNITVSGSIADVDYIDFDTSTTFASVPGRLGWNAGSGTLQLGLSGGNVDYSLGEQILQYCFNKEATTLTKGQVVYISGSQGNQIAIKLASNVGDPSSAGTLGFVAETITAGGSGWIITEGNLRKINTIGLPAGALLYLGTTPGTYTTTKPIAPKHEVRLGYVERVHATVGSIYVKVDNGYEIGELHDVVDNTTSSSHGDLLVKSGSVWHNSKQLTGSYGVTGSLQVTAGITGSLFGTASFATTAATASYSDAFNIGQTQTKYTTVPSSINGSNTIFNQTTGSYTSAFFKYTVSKGANSRSGEIMSVWNGTTVAFTDNSTTDIGSTTPVTASVVISGANVRLNMQTNTSGWKVKSIATFM